MSGLALWLALRAVEAAGAATGCIFGLPALPWLGASLALQRRHLQTHACQPGKNKSTVASRSSPTPPFCSGRRRPDHRAQRRQEDDASHLLHPRWHLVNARRGSSSSIRPPPLAGAAARGRTARRAGRGQVTASPRIRPAAAGAAPAHAHWPMGAGAGQPRPALRGRAHCAGPHPAPFHPATDFLFSPRPASEPRASSDISLQRLLLFTSWRGAGFSRLLPHFPAWCC